MGREADTFRAALTAHTGGSPSAVQTALINQAVQLRLRLMAMDQRFLEQGGQSEHDGRTYLAWANSLGRALRLLGLKGAAEQAPSLAGYLAGRANGAGTDGGAA